MFGAHSVQGTGSPANGSYSYDRNGYYVKGMVSAYSEQGKVLSNYYVYEFSATLTGLSNGSELVISSYQTENHLIRFVLRGPFIQSFKNVYTFCKSLTLENKPKGCEHIANNNRKI